MKIPPDAIIPEEKLTNYLLVLRSRDDKSKFLAQGGFTHDNPDILREAIRTLTSQVEALEDGINEYGQFYRIEGNLEGPSGSQLGVVIIWLKEQASGIFRFITLKPRRESRNET